MQRFVDNVLAVTKESVKTVTYESLHNIVRLINGISAILLTVLPGKTTMLEGLQGWELKPTFRGPRLPRWMGNGVSSFNRFIHELSVDSDASSVEYLSGEDDSDGDITPSTPLSPRSLFSHTSTFHKRNDPWYHWIGCIFSWIMLPFRCLLGLPFHLYYFLCSKRPRSHALHQPIRSRTPIKIQSLKDHAVHHATDRRRGVIEDLHLAMEISIETIFDFFHKAAHFLLSPVQALNILFGWVFCRPSNRGYAEDCPVESIQTATLGADDPTPAERKTTFHPLNTDARTCQDVITELGYPYEAIHVVTADGYILLLERIPRRDSRKAAYLQHGVFDSSMGWIANGVVGSPAFAAFDQGYDVFLGNFRGLVSREHANRNMSSKQYWKYSINEHGTADIPALIEKIHEVKTAELKLQDPNSDEVNGDEQPYNLCAICHSLGGAGILMYLVTRLVEQKPHRLSRLVLLSPAGFHDDSTFVFTLVEYFFLTLGPILAPLFPAFYIPTRFFRMLVNKLARDLHNYPAVGGLIQTLMGYVVGGDSSNWVGVLGLPHYNMNDMPGVSFYVAVHLAQMKRTGRFRMFDHGSASANMRAYGSPQPLDLAECYGLIDIPVDLVAGKKDRVIRASMVRRHYRLMKAAGVEVSYKEFEYAHLDFTFSHREELLAYVMSRVQLVKPSGAADAESAKVDKLK